MSENSNTVEVKDEKLTTKSKSTKTEKVLFIIGIVLIVLMLPILILDAVLLIKSAVNPDDVPSVFGYKPLVIMSESMEEITSEEALLKQEIARKTLEDPNFIWTTNDPFYKHDLIFVKETDIHDYLKSKGEADIEEVNKELVGRTIAFKDFNTQGEWSVIVHRIAKVARVSELDKSLGYDTESGWKIYTYGINNPSVDNGSIDPDIIIGEWHGSRVGGVGELVAFLQTWYGIVIFVVVPIGVIILFDVITSRQQAKKQQEEKNKEYTDELEKLRALNEELKNKLNEKEDDKKEE